jgi:hypothetical protein
MSTPKSPKQVKVYADRCSPGSLELFNGKDSVVFIQSGPNAPTKIHVDGPGLFGTTTCLVGATVAEAKVYPAQAPGNFVLGVNPAALNEVGGKGTVQVLCLGIPTMAMGESSSGSIKVIR